MRDRFAFHWMMAAVASFPPVRDVLRGARRRGPRAPPATARPGTRRRRVPGDIPACAQGVRSAPTRRASPRLGADDRLPRGDRHASVARVSRPTSSRRCRTSTGVPRTRNSPSSPTPFPEGARRRRAPLRLRPRLRPDRRRARLERGGRPTGDFLRRQAHPKEDHMTIPTDLDRRFRDDRRARGPLRRGLRRHRQRARPAPGRRDRPRARPYLLRPGARAGARGARAARGQARAPRPAGARRDTAGARRLLRRPPDAFDLALDLRGLPDFTLKVLQELSKVPYGQTATYGELAERAGNPRASRAVGTVMNRNRIPIVLPCHRIVGSSGDAGRLRRRPRPQGASPPARRRDALVLREARSAGADPRHGRSRAYDGADP